MKKLILSTILSVLTFISPFSAYAIFNGTAVSEAEYRTSPVVGIYSYETATTGQLCTGVLLDSKTILSAAHCFKEFNPIYIKVYRTIGLYEKNVERTEVKLNTNQVHTHKLYNADKNTNDLAIIKLENPLPKTNEVIYPSLANSLNDFEEFIFFGYGDDLSQKTGILNTVIKSKASLRASPPGFENSLRFDQTDLVGISSGDSGGPLMAIDGPNTFLIGINGGVIGIDGTIVGTKASYVTKVSSAFGWLRDFGVRVPLN